MTSGRANLERDFLPDDIREAVAGLIEDAGITANRALITQIIVDGLGLGRDHADRLDLKITSSALEEMRDAFRMFAPYKDIPKVTVFGSARTRADDPSYEQASKVASSLARDGWMVVTGAGPGIMQAASEGAGRDRALGVSIRLPFENEPTSAILDDTRIATMKYFFTRKLMLVKESRGFVCLPGGFGTLDETFELLTLQQTGKAEPVPIVMLDRPGGSYWSALADYVRAELASAGLVAPDDLDRVLITDSVERAAEEITRFWSNYRSLRWVGDRLVLRMRRELDDSALERLNEEFGALCAEGRFERTEPLQPERIDHDALELHRIAFTPHHRAVGSLHKVIRAINLAV